MTTEDNPDPPGHAGGLEFIETPTFTEEWKRIGLDDEDLRALQTQLLFEPDAGDVIPAGRGLRKLRFGAKGKGKRGGCRIIYRWRERTAQIVLLLTYPKNERDDLTPKQLRILRELSDL